MAWLFYVAGAVAIFATLMMLTRLNAVHALLYLIVSLLAVAIVFFVIGAPFVAALEVIIYAGAIMVLFVFVVMMLNLGRRAIQIESSWLSPGTWAGPVILAAILIAEVAFLVAGPGGPNIGPGGVVGPKEVGIQLFGPYLIGVELASFLLLAALVGAYHLGVAKVKEEHGNHSDEPRVAAGGDLVRAGIDRPAGSP
ncbi:MAG: NADH-quinone oxidoreductase subunit J [Terriglobia bacterium]